MKKTIFILLILIISSFLLIGCTEENNAINPNLNPQQPNVQNQTNCLDDEYYNSGFCVSYLRMTEYESKEFFKNKPTPFAITDWKFTNTDKLEVTIKNKTNESLRALVFQIGLKKYNLNAYNNLIGGGDLLIPEKIYEDIVGISIIKVLEPEETTTVLIDTVYLRETDENGEEKLYEGRPKQLCSARPRLDFIPLISYENTNGQTKIQTEKTPLIINCNSDYQVTNGKEMTNTLFIGEPTVGERLVLDNLKDTLNYRIRDARSLSNTTTEELSQYDIVILDQSLTDKSVTVALGEAINKYVNKGGKLIVVKNSGIYQNVGLYGATADVVGWKATFGNIMPMECSLDADNIPSCIESQKQTITGRILVEDDKHPIMIGIEQTPPTEQPPYTLQTFVDIQTNNATKRIAYIKEEGVPRASIGILEKSTLLGKVIYFNYDPGLTPTILTNTINYLKK